MVLYLTNVVQTLSMYRKKLQMLSAKAAIVSIIDLTKG